MWALVSAGTADSLDSARGPQCADRPGILSLIKTLGGRLASVPLLEGQAFVQVALVFALIGGLGLVLKWTFSRGKNAPRWPTESPTHAPTPTTPAAAGQQWSTPSGGDVPPHVSPDAAAPERPAQPEDYGLLVPVAILESAEAAVRIRARLAEAGIRATTAINADGRHRVLVFSDELLRARRVTGGA